MEKRGNKGKKVREKMGRKKGRGRKEKFWGDLSPFFDSRFREIKAPDDDYLQKWSLRGQSSKTTNWR